jgi:dihydropteroate synthase
MEEELRRVVPVIGQLAKLTDVPISIDTYKSGVAKRALDAGAVIVNDISGLRFDPAMVDVVRQANASLVIMHIKGTPKIMQEHPEYDNVVDEVISYLQEGIRAAEQHGIKQIFVDPGIGFGKTVDHNLELLGKLNKLQALGYPVLVGPSRKSFIGKILDLPVDERLEGTAAAVAASIMNGAQVLRVHDVKEMKRVAAVIDAIAKR